MTIPRFLESEEAMLGSACVDSARERSFVRAREKNQHSVVNAEAGKQRKKNQMSLFQVIEEIERIRK